MKNFLNKENIQSKLSGVLKKTTSTKVKNNEASNFFEIDANDFGTMYPPTQNSFDFNFNDYSN